MLNYECQYFKIRVRFSKRFISERKSVTPILLGVLVIHHLFQVKIQKSLRQENFRANVLTTPSQQRSVSLCLCLVV